MRTVRDPNNAVKMAVLGLCTFLTAWGFKPSKVFAQSTALTQRIQRIITNNKTTGRKGVYARWLHGGRIYGYNMDTPITPASCLKILSTGVALRHMGANYRFTTRLYGKYNKDSLETPLYWFGNGDPSITMTHLITWAKQLKAKGISKLPKGIVIDDTYFDQRKPAGFQWGYGNDGYLALPSPTTAEGNAITVTLEIKDNDVVISCAPASSYYTCTSAVKIGTKENIRFVTETQNNVLRIQAIGTITLAEPKVVNRVRSFDSARFAHALLVQVLKDNGFEVAETFARGKTPAGTPELLTHTSDTLAELVKLTNRNSNNLYAENILKALGAIKSGEPGTTQKGLNAIYDFLVRAGVKRNTVILSNGSGLFGNSMISPRSLANAMEHFSTLPWLHTLLMDSLPAPGEGTLSKRFAGTAAADILRAKTGTMSNASCLAGYLTWKNKTIVFAIMQDQIKGDLQGARNFQDEIVVVLAKYLKNQQP